MKKILCGRGRIAFYLLLLLEGNISLSLAQLPTATILGTVKDSSGAVVPGTALTARNLETGQSRTGSSAADGSYRFPALLVGSYEIRVEHPGFQTAVRSGVTLTVGQEAVVNFTLQLGAVAETVTVAADAVLVNTTSGSLGGLVDERQVADLPLNGRNYADLTLLQPGVNQHRVTSTSASAVGTWFSANGAPTRSNYYLLDGAPMMNAQGGTTASANSASLGIEGIREWRVVTNSFSAEYGMRMGSQVTLVSKGGTNEFHGSLFEYLRNSALDARNFFDYQSVTNTRRLPAFTRNQFGASAGGPLKTDQLFFFATYEGLRARTGQTNLVNVIPADCHGLTNNRCAIASDNPNGNVAAVIAPLLALYPIPNLSGNRFTFPSTLAATEDYGQIRGDYNLSARNMVFVRYSTDAGTESAPLSYPQFQQVRESRMHFLTVSDTYIFSPALLGNYRFSYSQNQITVTSPSGISGPQYSFVPGRELGTINIGGVTTLGPSPQTPSDQRPRTFTWSGDLFRTQGRHSLKFGTLVNRIHHFLVNATTSRGTVSFPDLASFLAARTSTYSAPTVGSVSDRNYIYNTFGFYLQDDLRAMSPLTLNLGLRYEFHTELNDSLGHARTLRDTQRGDAFTVGPLFRNPSRKNISPRFGFAWDVRGNGKTAVRGGLGLLYDIVSVGSALLNVTSGQFPSATISSVPTPSTLTSLPLAFPSAQIGRTVRKFDWNLQNPHMVHYNFTVERQLPFATALSVAYAGSRGFNLIASPEANPVIPQIQSDGRFFWTTGTLPRLNPNWAGVTLYTSPASSWYHSLQVVGKKSLHRGLQFQSAYTWSKLIDLDQSTTTSDTAGGGGAGHPWLNNTLRGLANFHIAHTYRLNAIYRLPNRSGWNGFAAALLNGWWTSGILSAQTGRPFGASLSSNRSRSQGGNDRPDLMAGRTNENITHGTSAGCLGVPAGQKLGGLDRYFDPCAFALQPAGFLGNAGRNFLIAPGEFNLDFSLVKDTPLAFFGESGKLEFRAEFFNILNRANFGFPSANVFSGTGANAATALATAGTITNTLTASRQIQFALKVLW